jgi:hypothetical protein
MSTSALSVNYTKYINPSEPIWKKPTYIVTVAVDTEYKSVIGHPTKMITSQLAFSSAPEDCLVLEHPSVGLGRCPVWTGRSIYSDALGYPEVELAAGQEADGYLVIEHLMFFAPNDLLRGCFRDLEDQRRIQQYCKQDARIRISTKKEGDKRAYIALEDHLKLNIYVKTSWGVLELVLVVKDLGKLAVGGLAATASGMGLQMEEKSTMDEWKSKMDEAYATKLDDLFQVYLKYAKKDSSILFELRAANNRRIENIFGVHSLPFPKNEVLTTGSLVAKLLTTYIEKFIGDNKAYELFTYKDLNGKEKKYNLEMMLEKSTVAQFATKTKNSLKALLALIQGGRAKNECPLVISKTGVIGDIDLASAYATIIRLLTYPVGMPVTYGLHHESKAKHMTLGQWMDKNEADLVPRLWHVLVDGTLNHEQDLVSSKLIEDVDLVAKYSAETCKIPAEFRLYLNELKNGVITSDTWEILSNVCSNQELSEWKNLKVAAALHYPKSLRCNTAEDWYQKTQEHIEATGGSVEEKLGKNGSSYIIDNRSRYWLAIPLDAFIDPYISKRNIIKDEMKAVSEVEGKTDKYYDLYAKQDAMKLVCNVCYGVLASPYFKVGDVTLANNITAMARGLVWMTAKALGLYQTITDGGAGSINHVREWTGKKPGMDTMAKFRDLSTLPKETRRNLLTVPLSTNEGDMEPWAISADPDGTDATILTKGNQTFKCKEGKWGYFDQLAIDHVRNYFLRSNINSISLIHPKNGVKFEYKDMYVEYVGHSQTNYRLTRADEAFKTKARGHKVGKPGDKKYRNEEGENVTSEIVKLFEDLASNPNQLPSYEPLKIEGILKCNQANEMLKSKETNIFKENDLVAGDSIDKNVWLRPLSLSMFHWKTVKHFKVWNDANEKLKEKTGYGLELYYMNNDGTVRYQDAVYDIETAINNGQDKLVSKVNIEGLQHPYFTA